MLNGSSSGGSSGRVAFKDFAVKGAYCWSLPCRAGLFRLPVNTMLRGSTHERISAFASDKRVRTKQIVSVCMAGSQCVTQFASAKLRTKNCVRKQF